jgi:hypothetical protein
MDGAVPSKSSVGGTSQELEGFCGVPIARFDKIMPVVATDPIAPLHPDKTVARMNTDTFNASNHNRLKGDKKTDV